MSLSSSAAAADLEREHEKGLHKHKFLDEEQLVTITIIEDFGPTTLLHHSTSTPDMNQHPLLLPLPSSHEKAS